MKRSFWKSWVNPAGFVWLVTMVCCSLSAAESRTAVLELQRANQINGPWQQVPVNELPISPDGKWMDPASSSSAFYRLSIQGLDAAGGPIGIPLASLSEKIYGIAKEHLESLRSEEPGWADAVFSETVIPIYNPAVFGGERPAYYELKLIPIATRPDPSPVGESWQQSPPVDPKPDRGYLVLSSDTHDLPVLEYADHGPTPAEKLRRIAQSSTVRILRYTDSFWVAEDEKGLVVASLGSTPYQMPEGILEYVGKSPTTVVEAGKIAVQDAPPRFLPKPYASYREFKADFLKGPVFTLLRYYANQRAKIEWGLWQDQIPDIISVPLKQETSILARTVVSAFDLEDPIASIQINPKGGLLVEGIETGASLLTVFHPDRTCDFYLLAVGQTIKPSGITAAGWSSWSTHYAASCGDIPAYYQEYNLSGCCSSGYSGCGATAWAMFYGYWDNRGIHNLIGGAGATPWSNDDDVRDCIRSVFDYCDTWCTGISGAAATNPWDMDEGYRWAGAQGEGINISTSWTVPYTSSGPRNRAVSSIKDHDRPAIVGTGYYEHYPLAYGYRSRKYTALGITWSTERQWRVNNGWGSTSCSWVNANSCWFGSNGYCY
ncbi:MAG TPA: hypothetical protein P5186_22695 [Candidatus Paceibacterota bacterium]|nr:hypothetical protein [Verrucomicrobiota bacterium]HRY50868.1 hypothetical protein [Candidatus Paceibacterota bacterium]HSA03034.1 hypothetical protein [Candidatus Paceibacterota bacterium]